MDTKRVLPKRLGALASMILYDFLNGQPSSVQMLGPTSRQLSPATAGARIIAAAIMKVFCTFCGAVEMPARCLDTNSRTRTSSVTIVDVLVDSAGSTAAEVMLGSSPPVVALSIILSSQASPLSERADEVRLSAPRSFLVADGMSGGRKMDAGITATSWSASCARLARGHRSEKTPPNAEPHFEWSGIALFIAELCARQVGGARLICCQQVGEAEPGQRRVEAADRGRVEEVACLQKNIQSDRYAYLLLGHSKTVERSCRQNRRQEYHQNRIDQGADPPDQKPRQNGQKQTAEHDGRNRDQNYSERRRGVGDARARVRRAQSGFSGCRGG